jgi:hypothetical protein
LKTIDTVCELVHNMIKMSWLSMPREFRLLEEMNNTDGNISFGPENSDITLTKWIGTMYLSKKDKILSFKMTCGDKFPSEAPTITMNMDGANVLGLKVVCKDDGTLKCKYLPWDENKSISDNLKYLYGVLNA